MYWAIGKLRKGLAVASKSQIDTDASSKEAANKPFVEHDASRVYNESGSAVSKRDDSSGNFEPRSQTRIFSLHALVSHWPFELKAKANTLSL